MQTAETNRRRAAIVFCEFTHWQSENEDEDIATSKVSLNIWKGNVKMT